MKEFVSSFVEFLETNPIKALLGIGGLISLITVVWLWGKSFVLWVRGRWNYFIRGIPLTPRKTVVLVPRALKENHWQTITDGNEPAMLLSGCSYVTNITNNPVQIIKVHIQPPYTEGILGGSSSIIMIGIFPHDTRRIDFIFSIMPPVREDGEDFKTSLFITDQFGNEHKIKKFVFRGSKRK